VGTNHPYQKGYTLYEIVVCSGLLFFILNMSFVMYHKARQVTEYSSDRIDRMTMAEQIGREFRETVRTFAEPVDRVAGFVAGEDRLILHDGESRFAVFERREESDTFRMVILRKKRDGDYEVTYAKTYAPELDTLAFKKTDGCVEIDFTMSPRRGSLRTPDNYCFVAALRGYSR